MAELKAPNNGPKGITELNKDGGPPVEGFGTKMKEPVANTIRCPSELPYFNIYKQDPLSTDKLIYGGDSAVDVLSQNGELEQEEYIKQKLETRAMGAPETFENSDVPFWGENPCVLIDVKYITEFQPKVDLGINRMLNAIVRLSFYIALFSLFVVGNTQSVLLVVISMIGTLIYKNSLKMNDNEEGERGGLSSEASNEEEGKEAYGDSLDTFEQNLFKSVNERYGEEIADRNTVKLDPMHIPDKPFENLLYGPDVKRHLYF